MMKKTVLIFALMIMLVLSSCGGMSVEDQVATAMAETEAAQTLIAISIAETVAALPTSTATETDLPTFTPTITATATSTGTPIPPPPPFFMSLQSSSPCNSMHILVFAVSNNTSETFTSWFLSLNVDGDTTEYNGSGFPNRYGCGEGPDKTNLAPGQTGVVFAYLSSNPSGKRVQVSLTVYTGFEWSGNKYSSGIVFYP